MENSIEHEFEEKNTIVEEKDFFDCAYENGKIINSSDCFEEKYFVYKHKNLYNGKVYYGIAQDCKIRWADGAGYISNPYFYKEILYYGWSNFSHEILFGNLSKEKAVLIESLLIQESNSYLENYGYNINYANINYDLVDCELNSTRNSTKRKGRSGTPVVYDGKYYSTIKSLAEEIEEDAILIANGLNPNAAAKLPKRLIEKGIRYATQQEIEENS